MTLRLYIYIYIKNDQVRCISVADIHITMPFGLYIYVCIKNDQAAQNWKIALTGPERSISYVLVLAGGECISTEITEYTYVSLLKTSVTAPSCRFGLHQLQKQKEEGKREGLRDPVPGRGSWRGPYPPSFGPRSQGLNHVTLVLW